MSVVAVAAGALGAAVWCAYWRLLVRPRYLIDYRYLFAANAYTGFAWKTGWGRWLSSQTPRSTGYGLAKTLFALALIAFVGAVVGLFAMGLRAQPMQVTMLLWVLGYGAFLAYHANLQPRYYIVLAVPLTALVVMVLEPLFVGAARTWRKDAAPTGWWLMLFVLRRAAAIAGGALVFCGGSARGG